MNMVDQFTTIVLRVSGEKLEDVINGLFDRPNLKEYGFKGWRCSAIKQIAPLSAFTAFVIIEARMV